MMEEKIPFESKRCPFCRETQILQVYPSHLRAWRRGTLIQDALPELNEHERETLVTGICRTCWGIYICPTGEEPSEETSLGTIYRMENLPENCCGSQGPTQEQSCVQRK